MGRLIPVGKRLRPVGVNQDIRDILAVADREIPHTNLGEGAVACSDPIGASRIERQIDLTELPGAVASGDVIDLPFDVEGD